MTPRFRPTILLLFANDRLGDRQYLRNLPDECRRLERILARVGEDYHLVAKNNVTHEQLFELLRTHGPSTVGVHFGGHAHPDALYIEDARGRSVELKIKGLAGRFAEMPLLRWVFLNGCATWDHVGTIHERKAVTVVATERAIGDAAAVEFAEEFYANLVSERSLGASFAAARDRMLSHPQEELLRMLRPGASDVREDPPWRLADPPDAPERDRWQLMPASGAAAPGEPIGELHAGMARPPVGLATGDEAAHASDDRGPLAPSLSAQLPHFSDVELACREHAYREIELALERPRTSGACRPPHAVVGLPGIGKRRLALAYAYRNLSRYRAVIWLPGSSGDILARFADEADTVLGLDMPASATLEERLDAVRQDLEQDTHRLPVLLIFVDMTNEHTVRACLPRTGDTRVLLTTELTDLRHATLTRLAVLETGTARTLLEHAAQRTFADSEVATVDELLEELGGLPLAISIAGRILRSRLVTPAGLLEKIRSAGLEDVLSDSPEPAHDLYGLFSTSLANLERQTPAKPVRTLLELAGWHARAPIDVETLNELAALVLGGFLTRARRRRLLADLEEAMSRLVSRGLFEVVDERSIQVHCLVQSFGRHIGDRNVPLFIGIGIKHLIKRGASTVAIGRMLSPHLPHIEFLVERWQPRDLIGSRIEKLHEAAWSVFNRLWLSFRRGIGRPVARVVGRRAHYMSMHLVLSYVWESRGVYANAERHLEVATALCQAHFAYASELLTYFHEYGSRLALAGGNPQQAVRHQRQVLRIRGSQAWGLDRPRPNAQDEPPLELSLDIDPVDAQPDADDDVTAAVIGRARKDVREANASFGARHVSTASTMARLAAALLRCGEEDEANRYFDLSLEIIDRANDATARADVHREWGLALLRVGRPSEAGSHLRTCRNIRKRHLRANTWQMADIQLLLGRVALQLAELGEADAATAEAALRRAVKTCERAGLQGELGYAEALGWHALALRLDGRLDRAAEGFGQALVIREQRLSPAHGVVGWTLHELGVTQLRQGHLAKAYACIERALAIKRGHDRSPADIAVTLREMGRVFQRRGDIPGAVRCLEEAHTIYETSGDKQRVERLELEIGELLLADGRLQPARRFLEQAYARIEPDAATLRSSRAAHGYGKVLRTINRFIESIRPLEEAVAMRRNLLGESHRRTLSSMAALGSSLVQTKRAAEAAPLLVVVLAGWRSRYGDEHKLVAWVQHELALAESGLGRAAASLSLLRSSLATKRKLKGDDHPDTATTASALGTRLVREGLYDEAQQSLELAVEIRSRALGDDHGLTRRSRVDLAQCHSESDQPAEALRDLEQLCLDPDEGDSTDLTALETFGVCLRKLGHVRRAGDVLGRVLQARKRVSGPNHTRTAWLLHEVALVDHQLGSYRRALARFDEALRIKCERSGATHPGTTTTRLVRSRTLVALDRKEEALGDIRACLAARRAEEPSDPFAIGRALHDEGKVLRRLSRYREARVSLESSRDHYRELFGSNHVRLVSILEDLGRVYRSLRQPRLALGAFEHAIYCLTLTDGSSERRERLMRRAASARREVNRPMGHGLRKKGKK